MQWFKSWLGALKAVVSKIAPYAEGYTIKIIAGGPKRLPFNPREDRHSVCMGGAVVRELVVLTGLKQVYMAEVDWWVTWLALSGNVIDCIDGAEMVSVGL